MTDQTTGKTTRVQRMAMPLAREVVQRPGRRARRVHPPDPAPPHQPGHRRNRDRCSSRAGTPSATSARPAPNGPRTLRAAQCREGWHLEDEPDLTPDPATDDQQWWVVLRSEAQQSRDQAADDGQDTADFDALIAELDEEITRAGVRGKVLPDRPARRHRSTRRRQDAPDLPRRKVSPRTLGKSYTAPDGKTFRPSMFVTLTCPSYGRVDHRGVPVDPAAYDYDQAARDALTFAALFDRFIQNLRRYLGHDVQYFAAVEPQRRLAPHIHIAIRGTIARAELRKVLAATYHQVWWPDRPVKYRDGDELPVWDDQAGRYVDPATGEILPDLG